MLRYRRFWIACGWAFVALIIYLSVTPRPLDVPSVGGFKTGHILAYFWVTWWFGQIWRGPRQRIAAAIGFTLMGIALEYVQLWIGYRDFAYADMVDDGIGAALGLVAAFTPLGRAMAAVDARL